MSKEPRGALDTILNGREWDLLEGTLDGRIHVENAVIRQMVKLVLAEVQLGLGEDSFDRIPIGRIALVEDELDIEAIAQFFLCSMVLRQIVGEEGDGNASILLPEQFGELQEFLVLAGVVEGVEEGDADVVVDGGGGLQECGEGVFLVDDGVAVHPRPVAILVDVLGEEDLVDVEEHATVFLYLIELLENAFWCSRPLLLAPIEDGLDHPDLLLLDAEFAVEAAKL